MKPYLLFLFAAIINTVCFSQIPQGALLHLRADYGVDAKGGAVYEWKDKNKPGISVRQSEETSKPQFIPDGMNGKPSIRFAGAQFLEAGGLYPVNGDYTLFVVVSISDFNSANNIVSGNLHAIYYNPPRLLHGDFSTQSISYYSFELNKPAIITIRYRQSNQGGEIYFNGLLGDSAFVGTNTDSVLYLGAYQKGNFLFGDIGEVIIYPEYIGRADQAAVQDYLFQRYAISKPIEPEFDHTFSEIPATYRLYPRAADDSAEVVIAGNLQSQGFDSIITKVYKDNLGIARLSQRLDYSVGGAPFSFKYKIHAELNHYKFVISAKNPAGDSVLAIRDSIVCGDVVMINGQSNSIFGGNVYTNEFIRTFGGNYSTNRRDTLWSLASGAGSGGGNSIGAWGMRLAQLLLENYRVPVCVINGGVGGTPIESHLRDPANKYNLSTIYGSMFYRAEKSGLRNDARFMFWYQGESNGIPNYYNNFRALYNAWLEDYPGLKKIYMVQIRPGCSAGLPHSELRDLQRNMGDTIKGIPIETMAAAGLPGHDGCHYTAEGYSTLGRQLFRLIARDFHGSADSVAISSPNISRAFFNNPEKTELALVFKPALSDIYLQPDMKVGDFNASLRDYLYLSDSTRVIALKSVGDTVFLALEKASSAVSVTYGPDTYYNGTNIIYEGPWIYNQRGVGAMTFYQFPISEKEITAVREIEESYPSFTIDKNPSDGKFNIRCRIGQAAKLELSVSNIEGRTLFESAYEIAGAGEYTIPVKIDVPGIYFCRIRLEGMCYVLKAVVVK